MAQDNANRVARDAAINTGADRRRGLSGQAAGHHRHGDAGGAVGVRPEVSDRVQLDHGDAADHAGPGDRRGELMRAAAPGPARWLPCSSPACAAVEARTERDPTHRRKPGAPAASSAGAGEQRSLRRCRRRDRRARCSSRPPPSHWSSIQLRFRAGAVDDPDGQAGITSLTARSCSRAGPRSSPPSSSARRSFPTPPTGRSGSTRSRPPLPSGSTAMGWRRWSVSSPMRWPTRAGTRPSSRACATAVINDIEKRLRQGDDENLGKEALGELMLRGPPLRLAHLRPRGRSAAS